MVYLLENRSRNSTFITTESLSPGPPAELTDAIPPPELLTPQAHELSCHCVSWGPEDTDARLCLVADGKGTGPDSTALGLLLWG